MVTNSCAYRGHKHINIGRQCFGDAHVYNTCAQYADCCSYSSIAIVASVRSPSLHRLQVCKYEELAKRSCY